MRQRTAGEQNPTDSATGRKPSATGANIPLVEFASQRQERSQRQIAFEDHSNDGGLPLVDQQLTVHDLVTQRDSAADPDALFPGRRNLVTDALARDFPFELGERQEDV